MTVCEPESFSESLFSHDAISLAVSRKNPARCRNHFLRKPPQGSGPSPHGADNLSGPSPRPFKFHRQNAEAERDHHECWSRNKNEKYPEQNDCAADQRDDGASHSAQRL